MKIDELVTALQPLAGWHIYASSDRLNETVPCYTVRRLERCERLDKRNVILDANEQRLGFPFGITLLAKNIVRVDWARDRVWMEAKDHQLGYFQCMRPIEREEAK